jgi:RNA polymerase sigma factor (sigma-70 family)
MTDDHGGEFPPVETGTQPALTDTSTPAAQINERWAQQLRDYDSQAWDLLLRYYAKDLRNDIVASLNKRGLPVDYVDDIEQETWRTAVEQIEGFIWEGERKLYHWLRTISYHHVQTLRRKVKEDRVSFEELEDLNGEFSVDLFLYKYGMVEDSPETEVALRESLRTLDAALQHLKPREREIVLRRLVWLETPKNLAADYGIEPASITMILNRAKKAIRAQISAKEFLKGGNRND